MEKKNPYKKGGMFDGAVSTVFENAKRLRNTMTDAELTLWMHLKAGINECKFRRQHPIGNFIVDFYCHKAKLIVEVDGSIHNLPSVKKDDQQKESFLLRQGYTVLRFTNSQVMKSVEKVLDIIRQTTTNNIQKQSPVIGGKSPL